MSAYSTPFELVCSKWNSPIPPFATIKDATIDSLKCKDTCGISYWYCLNCINKTVTNTTSHCSLRNSVLLKELLPKLTKTSYEDYVQKKPSTIYMLHDFQVHSSFTLNEDNEILQIQSNAKWKKVIEFLN